MAAVYPTELPGVSLLDVRAAGQRAGSPPPGHVAQRARTTSRWAVARVAWVFQQAELDAFELWFRVQLKRGARWFLMVLPLTPDSGDPSAPCYSVCRFPAGYTTPFLVPDGWRVEADLEIRDLAECALSPPIVAIDATVGYDAGAMTLPDNAGTDSALILYVLHTLADPPTVDATWGVPVLDPSDSSGSWRLAVYCKTGGGAGSLAGAGLLQWVIVAINGIDDADFPYATQPPESNSSLDNGGSGGVSVQEITYAPAADAYALHAAFIFAPDAGGAVLSGDPPGYTNLAAQSRPYDVPLFPTGTEQYNAQIRVAYKLLAGATAENPGDAAASPDVYASGGVGALIFGVRA
jgi:hypothetical protein